VIEKQINKLLSALALGVLRDRDSQQVNMTVAGPKPTSHNPTRPAVLKEPPVEKEGVVLLDKGSLEDANHKRDRRAVGQGTDGEGEDKTQKIHEGGSRTSQKRVEEGEKSQEFGR